MGAASKKRRKAAVEKTETENLRSAAEAEAEAAAMGGIARESLQSAAEAEAAAMEDMVEFSKEILQGAAEAEAAAMGEMARSVLVAEVATREGMAERSPVGVLEVAVRNAARNMGTAAEKEAVREAAEAVVAEAMQVRDMEEALAEIEDAVQAMGWAAAELVIMNVAQEVLQGAEESME